MKLEAVTICVGYADFLNVTLPINAKYFDRWVIVTTPEDKDTFNICHKYNVSCLTTNDFNRGGKFNKGRGVQRGLNNISAKDWIVHLDADIALPENFSESLEMAHLNSSVIYGADRMMVKSYEEWQKIRQSGYRQLGRHCYILPHEKYHIGTRWGSPTDGYVPIGFFQLFHHDAVLRNGIWQKTYAPFHGDAARSDVQFGLQWDRQQRQLLPELLVWHLESEVAPIGMNWKGRKTKQFGPGVYLESPKGPS